MNKQDAYYRSKKAYLDEAKNHSSITNDTEELLKLDKTDDTLTSTRFVCTIKEDWIAEIEKGIPWIEKAIAEERQFIRVDGETIPIEKVKKVSKNSVEHLARHSNMITHLPEEGKDIIPDSLYITEKLTDYAVYENRFLYYMLDYLDKFINLRLSNIEKAHAKYFGNLSFHKSYEDKYHKYNFEVKFAEEVNNNPFSIADEACERLIERIRNCQQVVTSFLRTNLMTEVAKAPMIKLPITKTNVLKMNYNFKNSLALYEYVASYEGLGYEIKEVKKDFMPYNDDLASELYKTSRALMFTSYQYGNEASQKLAEAYKLEEERRKIEEGKKLQERIERMRKIARESGKSMEEYMLLLEERNLQLLKDSQELVRARNEIKKLNAKIDELNNEIARLHDKIDELNKIIEEKDALIAYWQKKYVDDIAALKAAHAKEIAELNAKHAEELNQLSLDYEAKIEKINANHEEEIAKLEEAHEEDIASLNEEHADEIAFVKADHEQELLNLEEVHQQELIDVDNKNRQTITDLTEEVNQLKSQKEELTQKYESDLEALRNEKAENTAAYEKQMIENNDAHQAEVSKLTEDYTKQVNDLTLEKNNYHDKYLLFKGELEAKKVKEGSLTPLEEFTSRERFNELEEEYQIFEKFFEEQWNMTKKQIRKEILKKKK